VVRPLVARPFCRITFLTDTCSSFAAIDIAKELEKAKNATMLHVTFGAPPVGTKDFKDYFETQMNPHESWSVTHIQDIVPVCFAWCGSTRYLGWLNNWGGWWNDWSRVGKQIVIYKTDDEAAATYQEGFWRRTMNKIKWVAVGLGTLGLLVFLHLSSLAGIPLSALNYWLNKKYSDGKKKEPVAGWTDPKKDSTTRVEQEVGTKYHRLEMYIKLLEDENAVNFLQTEEEEIEGSVTST
jgi:hypothetical protein